MSDSIVSRRLWVLLPLVLYLGLVTSVVSRQGVHWDEQSDLEVTSVYLNEHRGWIQRT